MCVHMHMHMHTHVHVYMHIHMNPFENSIGLLPALELRNFFLKDVGAPL